MVNVVKRLIGMLHGLARVRWTLLLLLPSPFWCLGAPKPGGVALDGVPEGAAWVVHGEARQLAALPAVQRLLRESARGGAGRAPGRLLALARQAGINVTSDVQRIQAMSLGDAGTVAIIDGQWDAARLLRVIQEQPGYRKLGAKGYELHGLDGRRTGESVVLRLAGRQRLLAGSTTAAVVAVADALARPGVEPDSSRTFGEMNRASPGALLVLGARDGTSLMELVPDAAMLLQAESIMAQMGRLPGNLLGVSLAGQGADETAAANMATLLGGMQAMLAFRAASDPQWETIARTMRVQTDGQQVKVGFSVDQPLAYSLLSTLLRELGRKGTL